MQALSFWPPEFGQSLEQKTKRAYIREDYGRTKLFKGNLPILLTFFLIEWTDEDLDLIQEGECGLVVDGHIDYSDGFAPLHVHRTEFFFNYLPELYAWSAGSPEHGDVIGREDEDEDEPNPN